MSFFDNPIEPGYYGGTTATTNTPLSTPTFTTTSTTTNQGGSSFLGNLFSSQNINSLFGVGVSALQNKLQTDLTNAQFEQQKQLLQLQLQNKQIDAANYQNQLASLNNRLPQAGRNNTALTIGLIAGGVAITTILIVVLVKK